MTRSNYENREAHRCQALCGAGICEIDTQPQSIEATFTGRHETFQYTKVRGLLSTQLHVADRSHMSLSIPKVG